MVDRNIIKIFNLLDGSYGMVEGHKLMRKTIELRLNGDIVYRTGNDEFQKSLSVKIDDSLIELHANKCGYVLGLNFMRMLIRSLNLWDKFEQYCLKRIDKCLDCIIETPTKVYDFSFNKEKLTRYCCFETAYWKGNIRVGKDVESLPEELKDIIDLYFNRFDSQYDLHSIMCPEELVVYPKPHSLDVFYTQLDYTALTKYNFYRVGKGISLIGGSLTALGFIDKLLNFNLFNDGKGFLVALIGLITILVSQLGKTVAEKVYDEKTYRELCELYEKVFPADMVYDRPKDYEVYGNRIAVARALIKQSK